MTPAPAVRRLSPSAFDETVAAELLSRLEAFIRTRGEVVAALPFGRTPLPVYRAWRAREAFPWDRVVLVNVDEYAGMDASDPRGAARYFEENVMPLRAAGLRPENVHWLDGGRPPARAMEEHRDFIHRHGGLDLVLLGLGPGPDWEAYRPWRRLLRRPGAGDLLAFLISLRHSVHLGFNEAGTPFDAGMHLAKLHPGTRRHNHMELRAAVTLGPADLRSARQIVVLAKGESKRSAADLMLNGPVTPRVPATLVRLPDMAPKTTVFLDEDARPD